MGYNANGLYSPVDYDTLQNRLFEAYNEFLVLKGKNPIPFEAFADSNIKFAFETNLEIDLQSEILTGLIYESIITFLQSQQPDLQQKPYGSTTLGLQNAFESLDGMNKVVIDEPNRDSTLQTQGSYKIALDFDNTKVTDFILWSTFYNNSGCGIVTDGDIEVSNADFKGILRTYKYTGFTNTNLKVKLFYKYSLNFSGNKLSNDQIVANYIAHYNDIYQIGSYLEPAKYNDISFYPSLAYLNSQYSLDDGVTWLPLNEILPSNFNEIMVLDSSIIVTQDI